ncbi:MAG TPA: c-type cytochrome [Steroidobacteraceae bacterium]|nr:c-type cytochrome [Steroidobacteraceae bacterium]
MLSRLNADTWLAGGVLCLSALGAHAAGDPVAGEKKFYTCYGCHGVVDYKHVYPEYSVPKLRHQDSAYLVTALREYRSGERPDATMHAQAVTLTDQDIDDIAAYLQGAAAAKPGAAAHGQAPKQAAPCVACHGENGLGVDAPLDPKPPVLAGQHADYLEQALTAYRNGRRKNVVMGGMAQMLKSDEEVRIVADYFASQSSRLETATTDSK